MIEVDLISQLRASKVVPRLENDQLKLVGDIKGLPPTLIQQVKLHKEALIAFLSESRENSAPVAPISIAPPASHYPLSNAQKRIWVLSQFEGGSEAYNITETFILKGKVEFHQFQKALEMTIARHEILRTRFQVIDDEPVQVIEDKIDFQVEIDALAYTGDFRNALMGAEKRIRNQAFDLARGPLLRVKFFTLSEGLCGLVVNMHHIISDGWSSGILVQEILGNYTRVCQGSEETLPPLAVQYKDYCHWLTEKMNGDFGVEARKFWKEKAFGEVEPINLPLDFQRPDVNDFEGGSQRFYLEPDFYEDIDQLGRMHQTTLFNVFRAALSISLHRWTNQDRLILGTPVAGRSHHQLEDQIGLFVNTLPLHSAYHPDWTFKEYLQNLSDDSLAVFNFQDYPLDRIIQESKVTRDTSRNPLFDVMMVVQNTAISDGSINIKKQHGFELSYFRDHFSETELTDLKNLKSKFDLSFSFSSDSSHGYLFEIEYKTNLFKKSTIQSFQRLFQFVLEQVAATPNMKLSEIEVIDRREKDRLLHEFNRPIETHADKSMFSLFRDNLEQLGEKTALVVGESNISYSELDRWSNAYANVFQGSSSDKVGLLMARTENIMYGILGAFKAHKAYVPIDVKYPEQRIAYIAGDSELELLIVDEEGQKRIPESFTGQVILTDEVPADFSFSYQDKDLKEETAYLIYTSGSTGKPKGVEISHGNAIAFLKWGVQEFKHTPYELLYAGTSYCFDLSIFEMFLPLVQGKSIRILSSGMEITEYVLQDRKVLINTVPSVVRSLLDQEMDWRNVVALNMAGEPVPRIFKKLLDHQRIEVRNLYGPSEDTTYSTCYRFEEDGLNYMPIGVPVGDTHLYILDEQMRMMPIGVEGEVCLSGESVAKGYYNRPELTAEKFIPNPFVPGKRLYRTGDIGKWMDNGLVSFVGRMDDQVKVRGFRIELGEIQYQLELMEPIAQAVVVVKEVNGEQDIVAYYQLSWDLSVEEIKEKLASSVPAYMIPAYFMPLEAIPMNSNGKVDKKKLPEPVRQRVSKVELPKNERQEELLAIWQEVLKATGFGITDNFFELGGHSLSATKLKTLVAKHFEKEITLNEVFQYPTIQGQAELLDTKAIKTTVAIEKTAVQATQSYPLSFAQERLWVLTQFENVSKAYHMPAAFEIKGALDVEKLEAALNLVVAKHESLRTCFREYNGIAQQFIQEIEDSHVGIRKIELEADAPLAEMIQLEWARPFDLNNGPLLRCTIWTVGEQQILSFNMHHIISDGWSIGVLFNDVMKAYSGLLQGDSDPLLPLEIQYKDFAAWQRTEMTDERLEEQLSYWKDEVFADGISTLELPTDHQRPGMKTYSGAAISHSFSKELTTGLQEQANANGSSLFMALMANVLVLLKKLSNQNDITIGTPVLGRETAQLQEQIGFFVNTLPIRTQLSGEQSFSDLVQRQRTQLLKAFDNQHFPFEMLVDALQPKRDMSRSPLFDVMVVLQNFDVMENDKALFLDGLQFSKLELGGEFTKYDLTFAFGVVDGKLNLELEYNTDLFEASSIETFIRQLAQVFTLTTDDPEIAIADISLISQEERDRIIMKSDRSGVAYEEQETIVSRFEKAVAANPAQTALKLGDQEISYAELDRKSGQLACILRKDYGINREDLVVLHTDRTEWMLISILAVLKAGAAYVPVDPTYPSSRIEYILGDSQSKFMLTDGPLSEETAALVQDAKVIDISSLDYSGGTFTDAVTPDQLAYIIYTSGTTGKPKGVMIEHRAVNRLLFNAENHFDFDGNDRWTLFHSYCFDFSVWEMYGALLYGGTLIVVPKETAQDSSAFFDLLASEQVTVLNQTPTAFRTMSLLNKDRFANTSLAVRYVIFGGEALMPAILADWNAAYPSCKLVNMYGITETTVHVTYKEIGRTEIAANRSNIGVPIPTLGCYVLDSDLKPAPIGVIGELCVSGAGLARGYHNAPDLTAEKFVRHPFRPEEKIYRSGDFAKLMPNGDIEYVGRKDDQVKIRGHRIELSEVELAVKNIVQVKDAVVLAFKNTDGSFELAAYFIVEGDPNDLPNLRLELKKRIPGYMVPSHFIRLEEFPLTSNGKLDKKSLPGIDGVSGSKAVYVPPRNEIDQEIIAIWEEILGQDEIGIADNFFDLGGHSLKATRVISKIQERFGVKVNLKDLFADPTVANLSDYVGTVQWMSDQGGEPEAEESKLII